jgi:hypothetical protein
MEDSEIRIILFNIYYVCLEGEEGNMLDNYMKLCYKACKKENFRKITKEDLILKYHNIILGGNKEITFVSSQKSLKRSNFILKKDIENVFSSVLFKCVYFYKANNFFEDKHAYIVKACFGDWMLCPEN